MHRAADRKKMTRSVPKGEKEQFQVKIQRGGITRKNIEGWQRAKIPIDRRTSISLSARFLPSYSSLSYSSRDVNRKQLFQGSAEAAARAQNISRYFEIGSQSGRTVARRVRDTFAEQDFISILSFFFEDAF